MPSKSQTPSKMSNTDSVTIRSTLPRAAYCLHSPFEIEHFIGCSFCTTGIPHLKQEVSSFHGDHFPVIPTRQQADPKLVVSSLMKIRSPGPKQCSSYETLQHVQHNHLRRHNAVRKKFERYDFEDCSYFRGHRSPRSH